MITQRDMDKILVDVNRVLDKLDKRISALEEQAKEEKPAPKATNTVNSTKKT